MNSLQRNDALASIACIIAQRSTCDRKQVGAVIAREGRPISWGYNGAPPGLPHCDENNHGWKGQVEAGLMGRPIDAEKLALKRDGCRNSTHAEANALAFAARQGISTDQAQLFVTVAPCEVCARLLIAAGIIAVYFGEEYRDARGLELLKQAGVKRGQWGLQSDFSHRSERA